MTSLSNKGRETTTKELNDLCEFVKVVKMTDTLGLSYYPVPWNKAMTLVGYSDSSCANAQGHKSQMGILVLVSSPDCEHKKCPASLLDWKSTRSPRVTRSTLASEANAMDECTDRCSYANYFLTHLMYPEVEKDAMKLRLLQATDCRSLYDAVINPAPALTEKRTIISVRSIQDYLTESQISLGLTASVSTGGPEARDHNGCTALMFAVANGNEAITRRLILAQANVNNFDYENHSCLNYATQFNQTKLEEEDDGTASSCMSPSSRLQLPRGLPESETASCAESMSTEAPETSPLSAVSGTTDGEAKKKKKKVKEGEGEASPSDGTKRKTKKADGETAEKGTKKTKKKGKTPAGLGEKGLMEAVAAPEDTTITEPEKKTEVPAVPDGPTDEELAKAAEIKKEKERTLKELQDATAALETARLGRKRCHCFTIASPPKRGDRS
eukprot:g6881.t1